MKRGSETVKDCHYPWTWIRVTTDGRVFPCCFAQSELGNLNVSTADEIWNGPIAIELRNFIKRNQLHPVCVGAPCKFVQNTMSGIGYPEKFSYEIDFSRPGWPEFLSRVSGLSHLEAWGRWSDEDVAPAVRFDFVSPLPRKFTLILLARVFGPNIGQELGVNIGSHNYSVRMEDGSRKLPLLVDLGNEEVDFVEFRPPYPDSPLRLGLSKDHRKLGIGFERLLIVE